MIKKLLKKIGFNFSKFDIKISRLEKKFTLIPKIRNGKKVLFTQSFSIYDPCFAHDKLMSFALSLRGFQIESTYCDGIQDIECNVYGGVWGGGSDFKKNCHNCQTKSSKLWSHVDRKFQHKYSQYLMQDDYNKVQSILDFIPNGEWLSYSDNGWELGLWAKDILVNNYVVGDYRLIDNYEILGRIHLKNLLLAKIACKRIIDKVMPDRIISNDSYYGMWKMWELLARELKIPFYSHWSGTRIGGWCYAYNNASMNLDFSPSWKNFSKTDLTNDEKQKVEQWLADRVGGKEMIIDTASLASFKNEDFDFTQIDSNKPIALLSANVIWDLAALNKEVFSDSMSEWIIDTIKWFGKHPEFQLILKPHPAEYHPTIPQTKETVESIVKKELLLIPDNVFILSPKVAITVYDLISISKIGLVFTTSVGMEMAARGMAVITAGKSHYRGYGFTVDPNTKEDYYHLMERLLSGEKTIDIEHTIDFAIKFIKFNFFHYFSKTNILDFSFGKNKKDTVNISINGIDELSRGHNPHFDYIVDCMENGDPILSETQWPKES